MTNKADLADLTKDLWVVKHNPSNTWWRANRCGYTTELCAAGIYSEEEARGYATTRGHLNALGDLIYEDEAMPLSKALSGLAQDTMLMALIERARHDG